MNEIEFAKVLADIGFAIWFFLPAGAANMVPIFAARIPALRRFDAPMDGGHSFRGKRIFGDHKTWRGLIAGMLVATIVLGLQQLLVQHTSWAANLTANVDYAMLPLLLVGPLFGLGALGGDAIESFFKRQHNVAPGHGWFPFDQIDYIIGGALATAPFVQLEFNQYALIIVFWLLAHIVFSYIGYILKLKERPI